MNQCEELLRLLMEAVQQDEQKKDAPGISVETQGGIRYSVPQLIRPEHMEEKLTVRFRVGAVYRDVYILSLIHI